MKRVLVGETTVKLLSVDEGAGNWYINIDEKTLYEYKLAIIKLLELDAKIRMYRQDDRY